MHCILAFVVVVLSTLSCLAQTPEPRTPEEVVEFFMNVHGEWPGQYDHLKARIAKDPQVYAPLLASILAVPDQPAQWDFSDPAIQDRCRRVAAVHAHGLLPLLGRELAEPLIQQEFGVGRKLYIEAKAEVRKALAELADSGKKGEDRHTRAMAMLKQRRQDAAQFGGMMGHAIVAAEAVGSPVLVDPILEVYESGIDWRRDSTGYLLRFAGAREDIIPRLKKVAEDAKTPRLPREHIRRALDRYSKLIAEAPPGPDERAVQAPGDLLSKGWFDVLGVTSGLGHAGAEKAVNDVAEARARLRAGRGVAIGCVLMCMGALSPGQEAPPMPADRVIAQLLARRDDRRQDDHDLVEMARRKQLLDQIRSRPVEFIEPLRKALDLAGSVREVGLESPELAGPLTRAWGAIHLLSPLGPEHAAPLLVGAFADCRGVLEQGRARTAELRALANGAAADAEAIAAIHQRIDRLVRREGTLLSMMADHVRVAGQLRTSILVEPILSHYEAGLSDGDAEWPRYVLGFAGQREDIVPRLERIVANPKTDQAVKFRIKQGFDWYAKQQAGVEARERVARAPGAASADGPDAKPGPTR